jgi:hypothetical protein
MINSELHATLPRSGKDAQDRPDPINRRGTTVTAHSFPVSDVSGRHVSVLADRLDRSRYLKQAPRLRHREATNHHFAPRHPRAPSVRSSSRAPPFLTPSSVAGCLHPCRKSNGGGREHGDAVARAWRRCRGRRAPERVPRLGEAGPGGEPACWSWNCRSGCRRCSGSRDQTRRPAALRQGISR